MKKNVLSRSCIETPLGSMIAIADEHALYFLGFADSVKFKALQQKLDATIVEGVTAPLRSIKDELANYFAGALHEFKTKICLVGTPFQQQTWQSLRQIPFGTTRSYAQLAHMVGNDLAFRAVAGANGRNRFTIMVPCHRVINANGKLGGYSAGLERKQWLLNHEKVRNLDVS